MEATPHHTSTAPADATHTAPAADARPTHAAAPPPREHAALLHELTAALTAAATPEDVTDAVVRTAVASFEAAGCVVALISERADELQLVRTSAMPGEIEEAWRRFPLADPVPLSEAARTGEAIFIESREAWVERYPGIGPLLAATGHHAVMALPLVAGNARIGAMGMSFTTARQFTREQRSLASSAANLCAQALDRARLHEAERQARAAAEASVARLALLYDEAQAANRAKAEFLAVMSHELRTPLNAIGGYAALMESGIPVPLPEEHREHVRRILANERHLLGVIEAILEHARSEPGQVELLTRDASVAELLDAIEPHVAPQIAAKRLTLSVLPCDPSLVVRVNVPGVRQILLNLVGNAVKFTPPGGRITLRCDAASPTQVAILVTDTGIGIPAEMLGRIFEPFVQGDTGLTRTAHGVGLGLAISRDLARRMGGEVTVESVEGAGSVFTVMLPRA
jgi:signal transduction histidine kinase